MRGTFFEKPLEYSIEISGESWNQGGKVNGTLTIKNHGDSAIELNGKGVSLCLTEAKKFKAKDPAGIKALNTKSWPEASSVSPGSQETLNFEFELAKDCPITEKASSLYINCGEFENPFTGGHMQLDVKPINVINNYLEIFENFFKFKVKAIKNKKGFLDVKLVAPDSKELGAVEQLNLNLAVDGDELDIMYIFKLKKLAYDEGSVSAKSEKKNFEQRLTKRQHTAFGDSPNQDGIMKAINEILDQIKSKSLF